MLTNMCWCHFNPCRCRLFVFVCRFNFVVVAVVFVLLYLKFSSIFPSHFIWTYSLNHLHFVFVQLALALLAWLQCDNRFIHLPAFIVVCLCMCHVCPPHIVYIVLCLLLYIKRFQTRCKPSHSDSIRHPSLFAVYLFIFFFLLLLLLFGLHIKLPFIKWTVFLSTSYIFRCFFLCHSVCSSVE